MTVLGSCLHQEPSVRLVGVVVLGETRVLVKVIRGQHAVWELSL